MLLVPLTIIGKGIFMKDWRTTLTGVLKAIVVVLIAFNIEVPNGIDEKIVEALGAAYAVFEVLQGYFSKDKVPNNAPE